MAAQRAEQYAGVGDVDLADSVAVVTGATGGIGRAIALALGRLGATVVGHGRSRAKARSLADELAATDAAGVETVTADFLDVDAVRGLADRVAADFDRVDVLVNNAGAYFREGRLTPAGVERTVAVNHLAPFVLTNRLRDRLEASGGRVVTTSSDVHRRVEFDFDALESTADYDGFAAYGRSKFANVLFTAELARRLDAATANCFHPGFVPSSGLYRNGSTVARAFMGVVSALPDRLTSRLVATPAAAAATGVMLAASPAVASVTGQYFDDCERVDPAPATRDEALQRRLWEWSERVAGVDA